MIQNSKIPVAVFALHDAGPKDNDFLEELFREIKTREFALLDLPAEALNRLLEMQYKTQQAAFALQFPDALHQIVMVDGSPAGRIMTDMRDGTVCLVDIALLERHRGYGIGGKLLQQVCADAASGQHPVRLTVRFDNPAQRLYQRAGFVQTGGDGLHLIMEWRPDFSHGEQTPAAEEHTQMETDDPLSSRHFRTLLGKTLPAQSMEGPSAHLILQSVEPLRAANRPANARVPVGDSFALLFSGPPQPVLPTAMTRLTTPAGETLEVFLSALGWTDGWMHYEAIFNRMDGG